MKKLLIWDVPTRFLHWALAAALSAAFFFALAVDDDSPLFRLHMLFGLVAVFLLVLRLGLGLFGSRHVRFRSFPLHPVELARYFTGVLTGQARRYAGHNPGSAAAAVAMFVLIPGVVLTGIGRGGEAFEDAHSAFAYVLLAVIGAHLLGIVLHTVRHRENIAASMATGEKLAPPEAAAPSPNSVWGVVLCAVAAAWITALFAGYDVRAANVRLPVLGTVVQLGEHEGDEHEHRERHGGRRSRQDDDD